MSLSNNPDRVVVAVTKAAAAVGATLPEKVVAAIDWQLSLPSLEQARAQARVDLAAAFGRPDFEEVAAAAAGRLAEVEALRGIASDVREAHDEHRQAVVKANLHAVVDAFRKAKPVAGALKALNAYAAQVPPGTSQDNAGKLDKERFAAWYESNGAAATLLIVTKALAPFYGATMAAEEAGLSSSNVQQRLMLVAPPAPSLDFIKALNGSRDVVTANGAGTVSANWYALVAQQGATFELADPATFRANRAALKSFLDEERERIRLQQSAAEGRMKVRLL